MKQSGRRGQRQQRMQMLRDLITAVGLGMTCLVLVVGLISSDGMMKEHERTAGAGMFIQPGEVISLPKEHSSVPYGEALLEVQTAKISDEEAAELQKWRDVNADVCALIRIADLDIYDPVVQATADNKQWLRTDIYGEANVAGAIFMDYRCDADKTLLKLVHGHNMKDGTMFADVPKYLELESCKDAPLIELLTDNGVATYQVFSVISVNSKEEALPIDFMDSFEETTEIVADLLERSVVPDGEVKSHDLLILNTCWYGESGVEHNLHCIVCASRII